MSDFEVALTDSSGERLLTRDVSNLSFRSVDPGGFGSVSFDLKREVNAPDFVEGSQVVVYDAETGEQVGGGRILNPGRGVSDRGSVWQIACLGEGPAHMQEREVPYHLIDTRTDAWRPGFTTNARLSWSQGGRPGGTADEAGWNFVISPGLLSAGYRGDLNYTDMTYFAYVGWGGPFRTEIGGYAFRDVEGNGTNTNLVVSAIAGEGGVDVSTITSHGFAPTERIRRRQITTDWPASGTFGSPVRHLILRYLRASPGAPPPGVGGDDDWMRVWDMRVSALRVDRTGTAITAAGTYTPDYVLAHEAIIDNWARFCPNIDLANARIDSTATYQHRDLVWPEGITPYGLLEKLMQYDPAFTWALWERNSSGKYRAEWRQYDSRVRYELSSSDGFAQTSADGVPLRAVYVAGEVGGRYQMVPVPLGGDLAAGPTDTVAFPSGTDPLTSITTANVLGAQELEVSRLRSAAAQVTVGRKVYDHYTGRWVNPYRILPGYLCRVGGVRAQVNSLNVREDDGAAIYRVTSNDYSADSGTSRLELNSYTLTEAKAIADLANA